MSPEADSRPPITDLRTSARFGNGLFADTSSWGQLAVEMMENVPQLQWPQSIRTYHAMRNDSQVDALMSGIMLPAMRMGWSVAPNKAQPDVVEKIATDYNLPIQGDEPDDDAAGFDFGDHLYHALLAICYGHMYFDEYGKIGADGFWHIARCFPIMPQTISEINVADNGDLESIRQEGNDAQTPAIPAGRLVPYVWSKEGSNWTGRSMLRPIYRDWLLKDRALRIGAINLERAGAGIPTIEAPPNATPAQVEALDQMAQAYKAGEEAGGAIPNGARLRLMGVEGQQPDAIRYVTYLDETMARSFLAMFIQLGQTKTGSRALGDSFADMMALSLEAVADWFQSIFNKTVIRRDVDWNFGEGVRQPKIVHEVFDNPNLAVADLVSLIDKGAIVADSDLRAHIRKKYKLPEELKDEVDGMLLKERLAKLPRPNDTPGDNGNAPQDDVSQGAAA